MEKENLVCWRYNWVLYSNPNVVNYKICTDFEIGHSDFLKSLKAEYGDDLKVVSRHYICEYSPDRIVNFENVYSAEKEKINKEI